MFPRTDIQNCIIHQLRNSSKYVSYKDLKALMADLKQIYAAVDESGRRRSSGLFCRTLGQEISQDFRFMAGELGEPKYLLQVP